MSDGDSSRTPFIYSEKVPGETGLLSNNKVICSGVQDLGSPGDTAG